MINKSLYTDLIVQISIKPLIFVVHSDGVDIEISICKFDAGDE